MTGLSPNSLAYAVYTEIHRAAPDCAEKFRALYAQTMFAETTVSEITLLNRFWRLQLMKVPTNTYEERECLCDEVDFGPWLTNFVRIVLPTIVVYRLPYPET